MSEITYQDLIDLKESLRDAYPARFRWQDGCPVVESPHLPTHAPRKLSRWEILRCKLEDAAGRAGLVWPWSRVTRKERVAYFRFGATVYMRPEMMNHYKIKRTCP